MATKDELVAFGQANGVDVDSSMLKADIEAALSAAGYDPNTIGVEPVSETDPTEELERTSSDATYSTYTEAPSDREAEFPPPGRQVEQTRGVASEGGGEAFSANR